MPPKKAAGTASKTKSSVEVTIKSTRTKKQTASKSESTNETTAKAAPKAATKSTAPAVKAPTSRKRKAEDDVDEEPKPNGVKKPKETAGLIKPGATTQRKASTEKKAAPVKKAAAAKASKKPSAPRRTKASGVINHAPTTRLDVYVFGSGDSGELGLGSAKNAIEVKRPRLNALLGAQDVGVVQVAVGGMHTAILTHDNKILTWGVNDQGALGRDTTWEGGMRDMDDDKSDDSEESGDETDLNPNESTPKEVDMSGVPNEVVWTQAACTDSATFALTNDGFVYGWGTFRSNEGIFGFSADTVVQQRPIIISKLSKITKLATGSDHVLALASNGAVFAWGSGQQNQLGRRILERKKLHSLVPTEFGLPQKMTDVGAGAYHSFAVHQNGDVYSWGLNSFGETGIAKDIGEGGQADVHHPTIIEALREFGKVTHIEGGSHHTVAVTEKGELLVWGRLDGYQLGLKISDLPAESLIKDSADKPRILTVPTRIPGIEAVYAAAGSDHCVAVAKDGKAYSWGFSTSYQTGLGTTEDVEVATHIDNTATRGKKLVWAGAGGQFSVVAGVAGEEVLVNGVNGHA